MTGASADGTGRVTAPDGVGLAYDVTGAGPVVVLLHGFASDSRVNWVRPGVVAALAAAGHTVVAYDARGHGHSDKPHDPAAYAGGTLVRDAVAVLDHLGVDEVDVVGYSMGAQVAAGLAVTDGRVRRLVLGGIGSRLLVRRPDEEPYPAAAIADGLEAEDPATVTGATPRAFRAFADATKADRLALAALQRARAVDGRLPLERVTASVLVVVGEGDTLVGDPGALVAALPRARLVIVPGDHLSAVTKPEFVAAVTDFLAG